MPSNKENMKRSGIIGICVLLSIQLLALVLSFRLENAAHSHLCAAFCIVIGAIMYSYLIYQLNHTESWKKYRK